jgi:DNA-binding IclR family transcriptional regulator
MVQTLEDIGAIVRDSSGRYGPGMLLLDLSQDVAPRDIWSRVSSGVLEELAREFGVSAHVGVLENGMVTYVAKAGAGPATLRTSVGTQLEAYCTAIGKVLLAALPERELCEFLDEGELIPLTERTITDRDAFVEAAWRVRAQGYARDDRETADDVCCLAAPIRNRAGRTVAAISVSDNSARMTVRAGAELHERLQESATLIGARLYRGGPRALAFGSGFRSGPDLARAS